MHGKRTTMDACSSIHQGTIVRVHVVDAERCDHPSPAIPEFHAYLQECVPDPNSGQADNRRPVVIIPGIMIFVPHQHDWIMQSIIQAKKKVTGLLAYRASVRWEWPTSVEISVTCRDVIVEPIRSQCNKVAPLFRAAIQQRTCHAQNRFPQMPN